MPRTVPFSDAAFPAHLPNRLWGGLQDTRRPLQLQAGAGVPGCSKIGAGPGYRGAEERASALISRLAADLSADHK
jgi:hypothetical protein